MKKIFASLIMLMWSMMSFAHTHTVARGETPESIAAKYNISEAQLIEANPGIAKLFYVGLVLNIPEGLPRSSADSKVSIPTMEHSSANHSDAATTPANEPVNDARGTLFTVTVEYGFLSKPEGMDCSHYTLSYAIGADYYFKHLNAGLFAGARIGYNSMGFNSHGKLDDGQYYSQTSDADFIMLPINAGYSFASSNRNLVVSPYVGIDFNFCVGGKLKQSIGSTKTEAKFNKKAGVAARLGAQLRIYGVNLGVSYVMPLNDAQEGYFGEDAYIALHLGFSI